MSTADDFAARYLTGRELYGDDFTGDELAAWFDDEREGYADLGAGAAVDGEYGYHALNTLNGFDRLPAGRRFHHALGVGSAYGREFEPLATRLDAVTILEPSDQLVSQRLPGGVVPDYVKPEPDGTMPFGDATFDLVLCFGTLHHIPNVSKVVGEMARVTERGGYVLVREPMISMGDWRYPRKPGVTKRERGVPRALLEQMLRDDGLRIVSSRACMFSLTTRLARPLTPKPFDSTAVARADRALSVLTAPLYRYHATASWQKVRPTSLFVVAQKR